jgi:uncharacterized protein (TIGR03437 family)
MTTDGKTIYASTRTGRLVQIDAVSGTVKEIVPRTPALRGATQADGTVPGSLTTILGSGLADYYATAPAGLTLPLSLGTTTVTIAGSNAPIVSMDPESIRVLVPLGIPYGQAVIAVSSDSPFQSRSSAWIAPLALTFLRFAETSDSGFGLYAIHQDFSSLVTVGSAARFGEVIHLYAVGLGDTVPAMSTGQPGPSNPPSRAAAQVQCELGGARQTVLFAGLAPGFYGIYQIDIALTDTTRWTSDRGLWLSCTADGSHSQSVYISLTLGCYDHC